VETPLTAEARRSIACEEACPTVTVVMPVRNEAPCISESLGAVLRQDYPPDRLEVIVADGASGDGTASIVREMAARYPNLRLIDNPRGIVPVGLNLAIRAASGDVIVRIDGHTVVEPDYVSECVSALGRSGADNVGGPMRAVGSGWFGRAVAVATSSPFGVGTARFHYSAREELVDTVYLGAWRRETFDRIGLFDEEMVRNQDDELNYRLLDRGGTILLTPRIRSRYSVRGTPVSLWRQYFQYGFWKVRVMRKHPGQIRPRQLVPPALVTALTGPLAIGWLQSGTLVIAAAAAGVYAAATLGASVWLSWREGWRYLLALPVVFATLHLSYGLGFLAGLIRLGSWRTPR
jgi:glycosyltransferase involved in cell wall biosynthesis